MRLIVIGAAYLEYTTTTMLRNAHTVMRMFMTGYAADTLQI